MVGHLIRIWVPSINPKLEAYHILLRSQQLFSSSDPHPLVDAGILGQVCKLLPDRSHL